MGTLRLTNVAQMALPAGRLFSYSVRPVGAPLRQLPVSFDQRRHVGEGPRPGSWMAIAARLAVGTDLDAVAAAWDAVVARHGTLRSVFSLDEGGSVRLDEYAMAPGVWTEHASGNDLSSRDALRDVLDEACSPFHRPSHCLAVLDPHTDDPDRRPVVIVGSDHAHVDMWSFLVVLRDLLVGLDAVRSGGPVEWAHAVPSFADHSAVLEAQPPAPSEVTERWRAIIAAGGGVMPVFPEPLGDSRIVADDPVEVRDVFDADQLSRFEALAAKSGVRMISLAVSVMTSVTRARSGQPLRAVFPVHSRHEDRWHDSVGWFITNAVIESDDPDPSACAAAVREAIALGSYPLAPIMAPYGGMPAGPGMWAISWLDFRRLPVRLPDGLDGQYVSAVVRDNGVMVWFVVTEDGLHLRARYPSTPQAAISVGGWLDDVQRGLRALVV